MYLTKSAFKISRSCPTKLYYHVEKYPNAEALDPYLELLAEGGFVVGKIAQLLYPEGVLVDTSRGFEAAEAQTRELLKRPQVTIFEATLISKGKATSFDILRKDGNRYELLEVKSQSFDGAADAELRMEGKKGLVWTAKGNAIRSEWLELVDDVTFQALIFEEVFPDAILTCALLLPDKAKRVMAENFAARFELPEAGSQPDAPRLMRAVRYHGEVEEVKTHNFLTKVPMQDEVQVRRAEVQALCETLVASLEPSARKIPPVLGKHCNKCQFRAAESEDASADRRDGFRECWGPLADEDPHLFDLYYGSQLKEDGKFVWDALIEQGKVSLFDIPEDALHGVRGERQRIQIEYSRRGEEWVAPELKDFISTVRYPLHFIDFETCRMAVPMHAGLRPYDQVAFQWSCHTVESPGAEPVHSDWINGEPTFPNVEFARSLRAQIGEHGTILVWATHEGTTLKDIADQMQRMNLRDEGLEKWLSLVVNASEEQGRLVDLNRLALKCYFHPQMRGSTSLKYVLPAVWQASTEVRTLPWLKRYVREEGGALVSPYAALPPIKIGETDCSVREGTAAMSAYQEMVFGAGARDPRVKAQWRELLRQYCELDTLAMVVVFRHWERLTRD